MVPEVRAELVEQVGPAYPHRYVMAPGSPRIAVVSRYPLRLVPGPGLPGVEMIVDGPHGEFALFALHVPRPWFSADGGYQVGWPSTPPSSRAWRYGCAPSRCPSCSSATSTAPTAAATTAR